MNKKINKKKDNNSIYVYNMKDLKLSVKVYCFIKETERGDTPMVV